LIPVTDFDHSSSSEQPVETTVFAMDEIDDILTRCRDRLADRSTFPLEETGQEAQGLSAPDVSFHSLSELTHLCLFYEDLLNSREEAISQSLITFIVNDIRKKIERYQLATEFFSEKSDQILHSRGCMLLVNWFHEQLLELEERVPE
jgi:hypothetical protein